MDWLWVFTFIVCFAVNISGLARYFLHDFRDFDVRTVRREDECDSSRFTCRGHSCSVDGDDTNSNNNNNNKAECIPSFFSVRLRSCPSREQWNIEFANRHCKSFSCIECERVRDSYSFSQYEKCESAGNSTFLLTYSCRHTSNYVTVICPNVEHKKTYGPVREIGSCPLYYGLLDVRASSRCKSGEPCFVYDCAPLKPTNILPHMHCT